MIQRIQTMIQDSNFDNEDSNIDTETSNINTGNSNFTDVSKCLIRYRQHVLETYSMKLFMAPLGLQDTKTIFFRNGEFLNALMTCGSEI